MITVTSTHKINAMICYIEISLKTCWDSTVWFGWAFLFTFCRIYQPHELGSIHDLSSNWGETGKLRPWQSKLMTLRRVRKFTFCQKSLNVPFNFPGVSSVGQKSWKLSGLMGVDIKHKIVSLDARIASQTITMSAQLRFPGIPTNWGERQIWKPGNVGSSNTPRLSSRSNFDYW